MVIKGVNKDMKRDIIGVDVCNNENETNWSLFFNWLKDRWLKGVRLFISDAHPGLVKAIEEDFPGCGAKSTLKRICWIRYETRIKHGLRNAWMISF
jgi:transposase-like protein